jgi:PIN domain nuclease of toxin-antitoxin system
MNRYLLDTNMALIATADPERLSSTAHKALLEGQSVLSVISYWEVMIKSMKGTLNVGDPAAWWRDTLRQLVATPLALRPEHISEIHGLPSLHKDPFDRALIAQAISERLQLVTTDADIPRYASEWLRVVS